MYSSYFINSANISVSVNVIPRHEGLNAVGMFSQCFGVWQIWGTESFIVVHNVFQFKYESKNTGIVF